MIQDLKGSMQSLPLYASRFMEMICAILGNYKETCYAAYKSMDIMIYIIIRVASRFLLVENHDLSQSQPFQNYQQLVTSLTCFVLYRSWSRRMTCDSLFVALQCLFWHKRFLVCSVIDT